MSEIKFSQKVQVTIFDDDHEFHKYENYLKVIYLIIDEIFSISSNKGTLIIHCPGCGETLYKEKIDE